MDTSKTSDPGFVHSGVTGLDVAQHIPCSSETVGGKTSEGFHPGLGSPTMPDEPIGGIERMAVEWNPPKPNRFDPFEALDFILRDTLDRLERHEAVGDVMGVQKQVYALRAYITGMEK